MKLTVAKYYTPQHQMYNLELDEQSDAQLAKAEELLRQQVNAGKIFFDDK